MDEPTDPRYWSEDARLILIEAQLARIEKKVDYLIALVSKALSPHDLKMVVTQQGDPMAQTFRVQMAPKRSAKPKAVGTPIQLTGSGPVSIFLDPVDATGKDVPVTDPTKHAGSLVASPAAAFSITTGADTLHYTAVIPQATPPSTTITLTGKDHSADDSFPDLEATQALITPAAPLPADLVIKVTIGQ